VKIRIDEIPMLAEGSPNSSDNPLLMSFFYFDFVHVLAILISLMALVFSYDLFSGEKENGTLRLIYANAVKQSTVITGKISGVFITLMPVLILCYLISIVILLFSPGISFSMSDWLGIFIMFITSFLYMALFVGLGILVSVKSNSSFNGIVISVFIWLWFLFLVPNISVYASQSLIRIQSLDILRQSMNTYNGELWTKAEEIRKNLPDIGSFWMMQGGDDGHVEIVGSPYTSMNDQRKFQEAHYPLMLENAQKKWQLQHEYLEKLNRQERISRFLSFLSPSEVFNHICAVITSTDAESNTELLDRIRTYRETIIGYFIQNKIFSSFSYFTPQPEDQFYRTWSDLLTFVTGGECKSWDDVNAWSAIHGSFAILYKVEYPEGKFSYYAPLDLSGFPKFEENLKNSSKSIIAMLYEIGALVVLFLGLFWFLFKACIHYDVR
jgi:ABC-type transport system involved in multi-copper enzyme maturation permease subunit